MESFQPTIRYDGFTHYSSERYSEVAALQYTMEWPELKMKQEYFGAAQDVNEPLGLRMYKYNEHIDQYEVVQRADFWDVAISPSSVANVDFGLPSLADDCVPDDGIISLPPDPEEEAALERMGGVWALPAWRPEDD